MIPEENLRRLKELVAKDKLVLFVGAGISYNSTHATKPSWRIPMWSALAKKVAKDAGIEPNEYNDVLDLFDGVQLQFGRTFLEESVARHLDDKDFSPSDVHRAIMESGISTIYTTNYDSLITRSGHAHRIVSEKDYDRMQADGDRYVYQIHGTLQDLHTLTRNDYRTWESRRPRAVLKLMQHFAEKTFLFVGYSLRDPHLTDGILPHVKKMLDDRQHPHYAWMWELKDGPRKLLQQRDGIEACSVDSDREWISAFKQIATERSFRESTHERSSVHIPSLDGKRTATKVNPYKLYYFRHSQKKTIHELSRVAGIPTATYKSWERVANLRSPPSIKNFKSVPEAIVERLELFLHCSGQLTVNGADDLRGLYIEYYIRNRTTRSKAEETEQDFLSFETKAVVFDFDGTLTVSDTNETTWESLWIRLGYDIGECAKYHAMYTSGRITHRRWCEITRDRFRDRDLTRDIVEELSGQIRLIEGVQTVFQELRRRNIPIYIVSGSVKEIIKAALGNLLLDIDGLFANSFEYDHSGKLKHIESTKFDFEGKAEYLKRLAGDMSISTAEILFVGNSINDEFAAQSGARTLCVNPTFTNPDNRAQWNYAIRRLNNLADILPFTRQR